MIEDNLSCLISPDRRSCGKGEGEEQLLYFLLQSVPRDYPRLNLRKGTPMCKVLADSPEELMRWGKRHGLRRIHISRNGKPHYDLWGSGLVLCPCLKEMIRHRDMYRTNFIKHR